MVEQPARVPIMFLPFHKLHAWIVWAGIDGCAPRQMNTSSVDYIAAKRQAPGTIAGAITDPDGHAGPRIPVQAVNVATKVVYRTTSSATGEYSIASLPAGTYQLTTQVSTAAFRPFVRDDLRITPGQTVRLDIRLEEGIALNPLGDGRDFFKVARPGLVPSTGAAPRMPDGKPDCGRSPRRA